MDRGWLERCQVFTEVRDEHKPVAGNVDLSDKDRIVLSRPKSDKVAPENFASPQEVSQVRPVNVDPSSGATNEEMKLDHITDNQDDNDQSRPSSETRKQTRKPRLKKAQDSKDPDYEQSAVKRKGRKRQRETEEGEKTGQTESVQKRRRTKKEDTVDEKPVKKGRRKKGGGAEEEESAPETKASQKPKMPQENLLGEVDEEDVRAASSRKRNPIKSR